MSKVNNAAPDYESSGKMEPPLPGGAGLNLQSPPNESVAEANTHEEIDDQPTTDDQPKIQLTDSRLSDV